MLIYVYGSLLVSVATGYSVLNDEHDNVQEDKVNITWPKIYTVMAKRLSLSSNFEENLIEWRTYGSLRIDYNIGAVKIIKHLTTNDTGSYVTREYYIHPETKDGIIPFMACNRKDAEDIKFDNANILPKIKKEDRFKVVDLLHLIESDDAAGDEPCLPRIKLFTLGLKSPKLYRSGNKDEDNEFHSFVPSSSSSKNVGTKLFGQTGGYETVFGITVFESITFNNVAEVRKTIRATNRLLKNGEVTWVPVRYDIKIYNRDLGALVLHEIWEYFNFDYNFNTDVFDVEYHCAENQVIQSADSDNIIKELMFINPENKQHVDYVFQRYIANFNRVYSSKNEENMRKAIFTNNMRIVAAVNKKNLGYKLAINHFSDRTPDELHRSKGLKRLSEEEITEETGYVTWPHDRNDSVTTEIPKEYDMRLQGLISKVKNQDQCGSCWAFTATATVEGALARNNGSKLMSLSTQAIIDCAWRNPGGQGCSGGNPQIAFNWIEQNGIPTEEEYGSYENKEDFCHIANMSKTYRIRGYKSLLNVSIEDVKALLIEHGPLTVALHSPNELHNYSGGIFRSNNCPSELSKANHGMVLVGYGEKDGELYWILKNSWGVDWGIAGYLHIAAKGNICGVTTLLEYVFF